MRHVDPDDLVHIGGMSHFLSPPDPGAKGGEAETPSWAAYHGMEPRLAVTRYTAALLRSLVEQTPRPDLPPGLDPTMEQRLLFVRDEIVDLVERYRAAPPGRWEAGSLMAELIELLAWDSEFFGVPIARADLTGATARDAAGHRRRGPRSTGIACLYGTPRPDRRDGRPPRPGVRPPARRGGADVRAA